ncbi:MAG: DUF420 domain-containing protein [bacterium]
MVLAGPRRPGMDNLLPYFPALDATLNFLSAVFLSVGYYFIRHKKVLTHRACMITAFVLSIIFFISYITYHVQVGTHRFQGSGWLRPLYFGILTTHTILAATIPVLAILTVVRAHKGLFARHRAIARVTLPLWLYVSVTGVIVYFMLYRM